MKAALIAIAFLIGGFMTFDGVHVLLKGKYFGPEKPGPWAGLFSAAGIDPFKLSYLFILFGVAWLIMGIGFSMQADWAWKAGMALAVFTLWYLPVGTLLSVITLVLLMLLRNKF